MAFGRRKRGGADPAVADDAAERTTDGRADDPGDAAGDDVTGPYDALDAPVDGLDRLDLGGLRIPVNPKVEVRLEADSTGAVVSVLLVSGESAMQLSAFAAPRGEGIWREVRGELVAGVQRQGGSVRQELGEFGEELHARVPGAAGEGLQPIRFVGVDGSRWFLRAAFHGRAALDTGVDGVLTDVLRSLIVVRGKDPMPVRDPLPLRLPKEAMEEHKRRQAQPEGEHRPRHAVTDRTAR